MRTGPPGRRELRPKRQHGQQAGGGDLIEEEREQLQRGRISPVQVFPGTVHGGCCSASSTIHATNASWVFCFCFCGLRVSGGMPSGCGSESKAANSGRVSAWGKRYARERLLEFAQLGLRRILPRKLQQPLQMLDDGIERTVLVIGRAAKFDAGGAFGRDLLFERLHQAGFANAGLTTEQHDLSFAAFGLRPALAQQADFQVSADQRREACTDRHLKAALCFTLPHDAVQRQREW